MTSKDKDPLCCCGVKLGRDIKRITESSISKYVLPAWLLISGSVGMVTVIAESLFNYPSMLNMTIWEEIIAAVVIIGIIIDIFILAIIYYVIIDKNYEEVIGKKRIQKMSGFVDSISEPTRSAKKALKRRFYHTLGYMAVNYLGYKC